MEKKEKGGQKDQRKRKRNVGGKKGETLRYRRQKEMEKEKARKREEQRDRK